MFSTQSDNCTPFVHFFQIIYLFAAELEEPKIGISGKGLNTLGRTGIVGKGENAGSQKYFIPVIKERNCHFSKV